MNSRTSILRSGWSELSRLRDGLRGPDAPEEHAEALGVGSSCPNGPTAGNASTLNAKALDITRRVCERGLDAQTAAGAR